MEITSLIAFLHACHENGMYRRDNVSDMAFLDWLEERGDKRAAIVRADLSMRGTDSVDYARNRTAILQTRYGITNYGWTNNRGRIEFGDGTVLVWVELTKDGKAVCVDFNWSYHNQDVDAVYTGLFDPDEATSLIGELKRDAVAGRTV